MRSWFARFALCVLVQLPWWGIALAELAPTGKLPQGVTPTRYQLDFEIAPKEERFSGEARIEVTLETARQVIWLHGRGLDVAGAHLLTAKGSMVAATFTQVTESGVVRLEAERRVGPGPVTLVLPYSAPFNQSLRGLYQVKQGEEAYAYTHFQPLAARRAFPSFDEPRFKTPFDISITLGGRDTAISNAPQKYIVMLADGRRRVVFKTTQPIPTYLVALAVGDFDVVDWNAIPPNDVRSHSVPLRGIAPKGQGEKLNYALEQTAALMAILEDYFAIPYPYAKLDLVAAAEFSPSGMENVGAFFYRLDRILIEDNPSIYQLRSYAFVHAHELAHSWFGNLVTPVWWDDLWLNEAFATWMSGKVLHKWRPQMFNDRNALRNATRALRSDRLVSARQVRQAILSDNDIANAFDSITYSKGGGVLSMIENYMGPEAFRNGIRRFMQRHRHGVATADDFFDALAESAGDPGVIQAFRSFVEQPGAPLLTVDWSCDDNGATTVSLTQSRSLPLGSKGDPAQSWSIPLCLAYSNSGTRRRQCLLMSEPAMTLPLATDSCPAWVLPNESGAAYLNFSLPSRGWDALIENMDTLTPADVYAVIQSLKAAYEAGTITTVPLLRAAEAAATSPYWDVAWVPVQSLRDLKNFVLPRERRPSILAEMQRIYHPALARFDLSDAGLARDEESADLALLRSDMIWFMALDAQEPALHATLSRLGQAYLGFGSDNELHREVLHPNLVRAALTAATEDVGLAFMEALIARLADRSDAVLRNHIIRVLGLRTDPELVRRVWALILDPTTSRHDASKLLRQQARRVDNAEALRDWITENYDALLERLPERHWPWVVWRMHTLCSDKDRDHVEDFFGKRVKDLKGAPRALANVLEGIELCTAIRQVQQPDAIRAVGAEE